MSESTLTRRRALLGVAGLVGLGSYLGRTDPRDGPPPPGQPEARDQRTRYPLWTYEAADGRAVLSMPVNVRVMLQDSSYETSDVANVFQSTLSWSRLVRLIDPFWPFHDSPVQYVWDVHTSEFVPSVASYRQPFPLGVFTGEIGYHSYLWPIYDGETVGSVAIQAHKDVGSVTDHHGTAYDEAASAVGSIFEHRGWQTERAVFDYGISQDWLDQWGPTGDLVIYPPETATNSE